VIAGVILLFLKTDFGLRARATIVNPAMAAALGIDTARMNALSFALGSALAGFAGALAAPVVSVVPAMGLDWVVRAFLVVIVAGVGSIWSALGGAAIIGGWEAGFTAAYDATYAQITVLIIVWALVLLRPRGLFSGGGRRLLRWTR
jgi:branched-chain amino acid transport system permease protein/urea transport system permease protein